MLVKAGSARAEKQERSDPGRQYGELLERLVSLKDGVEEANI